MKKEAIPRTLIEGRLVSPFRDVPAGDEIYRRAIIVLRSHPGLSEDEIRDAIAGGGRRTSTLPRSRWKDGRLSREVNRSIEALHLAGYVEYRNDAWHASARYREPAYHEKVRASFPELYIPWDQPGSEQTEPQDERAEIALIEDDLRMIRSARTGLDAFRRAALGRAVPAAPG